MLSRTLLSSVSIGVGEQLPTNKAQTFRHASRPAQSNAASLAQPLLTRLSPLQLRLLSTETRTAIDQAVASKPVVLFMKGTPEIPQCGFSRASIQILGLQGVDPNKFSAFNVLENENLRQGAEANSSRSFAQD